MGLASGQLRFLMLTSRKNDLEYNAMKISNEKTSLARDMNKVTKDYQNSLNNRRYKLSNNNGSTYSDLSYKNLMKPSLFNNYKPYFITNQQGRIVLNEEYSEIAKSLGIPQSGGVSFDSLEGVNDKLSALTGIDASKITNYYDAEKNTKDLQNTAFYYDGVLSYWEEQAGSTYMSIDNFCEKLISSFDETKVSSDIKNSIENYAKSSNSNWGFFKEYWDHLDSNFFEQTIGNNTYSYVSTHSLATDAIDSANAVGYDMYIGFMSVIEGNSSRFTNAEMQAIKEEINAEFQLTRQKAGNNLNYDVRLCKSGISTDTYGTIFKKIIERAFNKIKNNNPSQYGYNYNLVDGDTFAYREDNFKDNLSNLDKAKKKSDDAYKAFQEALSNKNSILNADEETSLEFYENILRAICEKGWCENDKVNCAEYLDNMLQNNTYMMTTQTFKEGLIEYKSFEEAGYLASSKGKITAGGDATTLIDAKRTEIDKMYENGDYTPDSYTYTTRLASDFSQLFNVTDTDLQAEAEAEYTYQRNIIKQKEARLDVQLEKIKTEQSAISQMMQSIKQQMSKNIERSMNVFSA